MKKEWKWPLVDRDFCNKEEFSAERKGFRACLLSVSLCTNLVSEMVLVTTGTVLTKVTMLTLVAILTL